MDFDHGLTKIQPVRTPDLDAGVRAQDPRYEVKTTSSPNAVSYLYTNPFLSALVSEPGDADLSVTNVRFSCSIFMVCDPRFREEMPPKSNSGEWPLNS
jgi:hypothetical protein